MSAATPRPLLDEKKRQRRRRSRKFRATGGDQRKESIARHGKQHDSSVAPRPSIAEILPLDFEKRLWTLDVTSRLRIGSDLREGTKQRFQEAEIEIAFPQRDIPNRSMDTPQQVIVFSSETKLIGENLKHSSAHMIWDLPELIGAASTATMQGMNISLRETM